MKPFAPVTNTRTGTAGRCPCAPTGAGRPRLTPLVALCAARAPELLPAGRARVELAVHLHVDHRRPSGRRRARERRRQLLAALHVLAVAADRAGDLVVAHGRELDAAPGPVGGPVAE